MKPTERTYYIDWLRVFAVILLVPFHTAMIFVVWDFHLKSSVTSPGLTRFNSFVNVWHMPLLFFLAGASTWFALNFRTSREYVKERFLRLFVPLVFGTIAINPPQIYFERLQKGQFKGSYSDFYPHFFNGPYPEGNLSWQHLWFLVYLFLFSLIALHLFARLKRESMSQVMRKIAARFSGPFSIYLPFIPFSLVQILVRNTWPNGDQNIFGDLDNFSLHFLVFVFGFIYCGDPRFRDRVVKNFRTSLSISATGSAVLLLWPPSDSMPIALTAALVALHGFTTWCWLMAFMGLGALRLNFTNTFLKYASEAALPFYILHQTVILTIGFYVLKLRWSIPAQYTFICVASFIATTALYFIFVRSIRPIRFLFGMK